MIILYSETRWSRREKLALAAGERSRETVRQILQSPRCRTWSRRTRTAEWQPCHTHLNTLLLHSKSPKTALIWPKKGPKKWGLNSILNPFPLPPLIKWTRPLMVSCYRTFWRHRNPCESDVAELPDLLPGGVQAVAVLPRQTVRLGRVEKWFFIV